MKLNNTNQKCTNRQFILRELNTQSPLTVLQLVALFKKNDIIISRSTVDRILDNLYKLQIIEYYKLNGSNSLVWETNNIWEHYVSESRRQDLMGYSSLSETVELTIANPDLNPQALIKYNGNLYRNIEQIDKFIKLQLLTLEEENQARHDRDTRIYTIGT